MTSEIIVPDSNDPRFKEIADQEAIDLWGPEETPPRNIIKRIGWKIEQLVDKQRAKKIRREFYTSRKKQET